MHDNEMDKIGAQCQILAELSFQPLISTNKNIFS